MSRRALRLLALALAATVAVGAAVVAVKAADGAFSGQYPLRGVFARSGEGLHPGSEVTYQGVQVGRVSDIHLDGDHALVSLAIDPSFSVPADATATIRPINVFGADEVSFTFPSGTAAGTRLAPGATIAHTAVSDELGDLFAAADPLLAQLDTTDLNTILSTLAQASEGEGPTIAASIDEGAKLAAFLDQTLPAQLTALDSLSGFTTAVAPTGSSLNALADASNRALPPFNAHAAAYARLLADLQPFANNLAQFLSAYHPDIETLLDAGDDVARVVLVHQSDIGNLVKGLGIYLTKFGSAADPAEVLPDGSEFGYFHTFIELGDLNQLVCSLLAPALPGMSFLAPLQQALTGAGTPLNCSSQISAFDAAQQSGAPAPAAATPAPSAQQAASSLSTQMYEQLTEPQSPAPATNPVQQLLGGLLG